MKRLKFCWGMIPGFLFYAIGIVANAADFPMPSGGVQAFLSYSTDFRPMVSIHRGGAAPGYPENALESLANTLANTLACSPAILEVDVRTLRDGRLILMHDETLDRTTTGTGLVEARDTAYIRRLKLRDKAGQVTPFAVPFLRQALDWAKGRAILTLDVKPGTDFDAVMDEVRAASAENWVMVIAYRLAEAEAYHRAAPDMMISVGIRTPEGLAAVKRSTVPLDRVVAWAGTRILPAFMYERLHDEGLLVIQGTLGRGPLSLDNRFKLEGSNKGYLRLVEQGADIIATDRYPAVCAALQTMAEPPQPR